MWGDGPCPSRWLYDALDLKCAPCPALSMGWPWRLAFVLLSSLRDCWELGVRTLMVNPGWWHLPAWHTGTAPTQHGASASSIVRWGGRGHSKVETEVGRGKVSENLALVIALWSRSHFLPEETGGGRDLPGGSRTSWGHPKESTRDRDRSLGTPSPVAGSELG